MSGRTDKRPQFFFKNSENKTRTVNNVERLFKRHLKRYLPTCPPKIHENVSIQKHQYMSNSAFSIYYFVCLCSFDK